MYRSLAQLKRYQGRVEDLCLDFTGAFRGARLQALLARGAMAEQSVELRAGATPAPQCPPHPTLPRPALLPLPFLLPAWLPAVESDFLGATVSEELVPGGSRLAVTNDNVLQVGGGMRGLGNRCCLEPPLPCLTRLPLTHAPLLLPPCPCPLCGPSLPPGPQYVYLVADWHLNKRLGGAAAAFARGLTRVLPPPWLRLFSPREVSRGVRNGNGLQHAGAHLGKLVCKLGSLMATVLPSCR